MGKFRKEEELKLRNKKLTNFLFIGFCAVLIIAGLAFAIIKNSNNQSDTTNKSDLKINSVSSSDWVKGNKESKIVLVEYSDFQCPACGTYYPLVNQLADEFKDKIAVVYRHFPLKSIHRNAEPAALAAESAGRQGKFWEMHNALFDNQKEWSDKINSSEYFIKYAGGLNIDVDKFKTDLSSQELKNKVKNDLASAEENNLDHTPTFFLNGKEISPRSYEEFKQIISSEIKKNEQ